MVEFGRDLPPGDPLLIQLQGGMRTAWNRLAGRNSAHVSVGRIKAVLNATLAYERALPHEGEELREREGLLTRAVRLDEEDGQRAAYDFFEQELRQHQEIAEAVNAASGTADFVVQRRLSDIRATMSFLAKKIARQLV